MWLLNPEDLLGSMQCELVEGLVDSWLACWAEITNLV